jgi:hypothetical protein
VAVQRGQRDGSVQARRSCACVAVSRATGGAPTYASRPRPTPVRDRLPACALSLVMRLVQAFDNLRRCSCSASDLPVRREGASRPVRRFLPGYPASARLTVTQTSCRITIFTRQTRNTYTTPIPLEAHRGSHIITSGLACNTVKHETAVVASFIVFVTHRRIVPRDAGRPSARR